MDILFATKNAAKFIRYSKIIDNDKKINKYGIKLLNLNDIDDNIVIAEDGKDTLENAIIKAKACYNKTNIVTLANDDGLYIDGIEKDMQPGPYVRRVNGKRLLDSEMIKYYSNLIKNIGSQTYAYWIHSYVIYDGFKIYEYTKRSKFLMKSQPCEIIRNGYPLDSLTYIESLEKYRAEIDDEQLYKLNNDKDDDIQNFIENCISQIFMK